MLTLASLEYIAERISLEETVLNDDGRTGFIYSNPFFLHFSLQLNLKLNKKFLLLLWWYGWYLMINVKICWESGASLLGVPLLGSVQNAFRKVISTKQGNLHMTYIDLTFLLYITFSNLLHNIFKIPESIAQRWPLDITFPMCPVSYVLRVNLLK